MKESDLIKAAQKGDKTAFAELYQRCFLPVFKYLFLKTKNRAEAEDLTQTVFLKVLSKKVVFQDRGKPFLAYLFTMARNLFLDSLKKNRPPSLSLEKTQEQIGTARDYLDSLIDKESFQQIHRAMEHLTEDEQAAISLRFFSGLSNKEISTALNKSEVNVRQLQSRGLRKIRDLIKGND